MRGLAEIWKDVLWRDYMRWSLGISAVLDGGSRAFLNRQTGSGIRIGVGNYRHHFLRRSRHYRGAVPS